MGVLSVYIILINVIGFAVMAWDKKCAIDNAWRIPEKTLFGIAIAGGAFGCWIGMYAMRHKTRHIQFVLGMPAILVVQVLIIAFLF